MEAEIINIVGGLVLCAGILEAIPAMGKHLEKLAKWLRLISDNNWYNCNNNRHSLF
ncbi:MAG: hypothetical protein KAR64_08850 [Thermoplasmatales archaeon]|nr:hypothetical protein [Thermoplasmatales archaeon]